MLIHLQQIHQKKSDWTQRSQGHQNSCFFIQTAVYYFIITNVRYGTTTSDTTCTRITMTAVVERHDCTNKNKKEENKEVKDLV